MLVALKVVRGWGNFTTWAIEGRNSKSVARNDRFAPFLFLCHAAVGWGVPGPTDTRYALLLERV